MSLSFNNSTSEVIYVVIAYSSSDCGSGSAAWMKEGWWPVQPGTSTTVHGGLSNGATYFYYAHTPSGMEWAGDFITPVPNEAFELCWNIGETPGVQAAMREVQVPITAVAYTVNLIV